MRIDLRRIAPMLLLVPLLGVGTAQLASNTVPPSSAGETHLVKPVSSAAALLRDGQRHPAVRTATATATVTVTG